MPEVVQVIAAPAPDYRIILYFDDGSIRQFDVTPLLDGPVFNRSRTRSCFVARLPS